MNSSARTQTLHLVAISAGPCDRVRLGDPYVEEVWSEFLGPTATLLARRLGGAIERRPAGLEVDPADLAASIGVSPSLVRKAVERLDRFEVVHCDIERGVVGVSGYAPLVGDGRVFRLSEAGRVAHERFVAALDGSAISRGKASALLRPSGPAVNEPQLSPLAAG